LIDILETQLPKVMAAAIAEIEKYIAGALFSIVGYELFHQSKGIRM